MGCFYRGVPFPVRGIQGILVSRISAQWREHGQNGRDFTVISTRHGLVSTVSGVFGRMNKNQVLLICKCLTRS